MKNIIKKAGFCEDLIIENDKISKRGGADKSPLLSWHECLSPFGVKNKFIYLPFVYLFTNNIIFFLLRKFYWFYSLILQIRNSEKEYKKSIRRLKSDYESYSLKSQYGYSGDVFFNELSCAHNYKKQIDDGFKNPSESKKLYEHIIDISSHLLDKKKSYTYFNFGISYAYTDAILAKKYNKVKFIGIERTEAAKIYNNIFFSEIKNLKVLSGDIFELLKKNRFNEGIFFHSRTLLLLSKEFVDKLYNSVYKAGFRYIVGMEQHGVSKQTAKFYNFSYSDQNSVVYRQNMYIHNYPFLLKKNGFKLSRIQNLYTDHPHSDFRILSFCASAQ